MPSEEAYLTIGKVVKRLQSAYPDLSVSKVRYLEEEGIVTPKRTPGGYRLFSQADVARLERALHLQKTRFLPLVVIRHILDEEPEEARPVPSAPEPPAEPEPAPHAAPDASPALPSTDEAASRQVAPSRMEVAVPPSAQVPESVPFDEETLEKLHPIDRIPDMLGVSIGFVRQLSEAGIVELKRSPHGRDLVEGRDFALIRTCDELRLAGIAPKNLRQYVIAANRESGMFEQALVSVAGRGELTEERRVKTSAAMESMLALTNSLRDQLIRRQVGERFKGLYS